MVLEALNRPLIFGVLSIAIAAYQYLPYIWRTLTRQLRPHACSYLIWGLSAGVVGIAQFRDNAGAGSWAMLFSAAACLAVAGVSTLAGADYIRRGDKLALATAIAAIFLWMWTQNALFAVVIMTLIDTLAYVPTLRKAWVYPNEESAEKYFIGDMKHIFGLLALENADLTTTLMSIVIVLSNTCVILVLLLRRRPERAR